MIHTLETHQSVTRGYFSKELDPVLTINSGDTVRYQNLLDARWHKLNEAGQLEQMVGWRESDPLKGHALFGPIAIQEARKGMLLEMRIDAVTPASLGWNEGGGREKGWDHWDKLNVSSGDLYHVEWSIDIASKTARHPSGFEVSIAPFPGVLGMPPDDAGLHETAPPRVCGGNIDCKMLVAGTSLYLPISVDGAMVFVGDGHAAQADGEASGTAIECPLDLLEITYKVHDSPDLVIPHARTLDGWITFGFDEDLDQAMYMALNGMLDLMMTQYHISRQDSLSLASVVVDLRVTQVVNSVQGVHAVLPDGALVRLA